MASGDCCANSVRAAASPCLRAIASDALLRRGIDLDEAPERAEALLGPDAWELVRPDRTAERLEAHAQVLGVADWIQAPTVGQADRAPLLRDHHDERIANK